MRRPATAVTANAFVIARASQRPKQSPRRRANAFALQQRWLRMDSRPGLMYDRAGDKKQMQELSSRNLELPEKQVADFCRPGGFLSLPCLALCCALT